MGLLDTILGRSKPVRANLDALFALPPAAVTLQVSAGLMTSGHAGVCFKPPAGQPFEQVQSDLEQLLKLDDDQAGPAPEVRHVGDKFGYRWILLDAEGIDDLVTRVHMVHSSLEEAGWSTQLLCSVFGFSPATDTATDTATATATATGASVAGTPGAGASDAVSRPLFLVYLAKRGTFYPFAPNGDEQRDTELELRIRGMLGDDLPMESDLSRWFPLWDLPVT